MCEMRHFGHLSRGMAHSLTTLVRTYQCRPCNRLQWPLGLTKLSRCKAHGLTFKDLSVSALEQVDPIDHVQ